MKTLLISRRILLGIITLLLLTPLLFGTSQAHATSAPQASSAQDIINAVNALRVANGLNPLNVHPALMQAAQWEASHGGGHVRPPGLTLGQWLISLGYPLAGDLSLDGYRSENWVSAQSVDQAIQFWLGDGPHTNTMLSPNRSDIGAAIVGDIYVLETALQTSSGEMQTTAYDIQTAIPASQVDASGSLVSDYIVPVLVSTARPDGDVIHKVAYGQSLWSVAIAYNTTIDQIRRWNNKAEDEAIFDGEILLVQKSATQPVDTTVTTPATATETASVPPATVTPTLPLTSTPTNPHAVPEEQPAESGNSRLGVMLAVVLALIGGGWLAMSLRMPEE